MPPISDEYVEVPERLKEFFAKYPEGRMRGVYEVVQLPRPNGEITPHIIYIAEAYRSGDDLLPGIGMASEPVPGTTNFTRGSELMNAETSAWGRALVAIGFVSKKVASKNEVAQAQANSVRRLTADEQDRLAQKLTDLGVSLDDSLVRLQSYGAETYADLKAEDATDMVNHFTKKTGAKK